MKKLLELIDELDSGEVGSGEGYLHEEIFDFVFGVMMPELYRRDEVWLILSEEVKQKYNLSGNIKLNSRNCKSCFYDFNTRTISVDISINGTPGIYEFTAGEYLAAYVNTDIGFVDVAQVVIQDFTAQITIAYFDMLGIDTNVQLGDDSVDIVPKETPKSKIQEVKGNVFTVDFGKPRS